MDHDLDQSIEKMQERLRMMADRAENLQNAYVTVEDIRNLEMMKHQNLLVVKAPSGTMLEVPDPDEGMVNGSRR